MRDEMAKNELLSEALSSAEQANKAKTAFLSNMSHEISTPMNAIIGLDSIALNDPETPDKTRDYLIKIGESADHLLGLINDYLIYLRGFFKTEESKRFLALGYITGILPIKKFDGESAMNNFTEYTMIRPRQLAPFFGFSDDEVKELCENDELMDINEVKKWYDGYLMNYIPNEEVRDVFESAIKVGGWRDIIDAIRKSDGLLKATWDGDGTKVAEIISESHQDYTSILEYHDENSPTA